MSSSSESDNSSSNTNHFTSTSSDEEVLEDMDKEDMVIFHCMAIPYNYHEFFTSHEIEEGVGQSVDPTIGVQDVLSTMQATPNLFKTLTNFTLAKFDEFSFLVVKIISTHIYM
jgi:hypothetical protein